MRALRFLSTLALLAASQLAAAPAVAAQATAQAAAQAADRIDYAMLSRIREEGLQRSQVMDLVSWIADVHGPRLTGSPGFKEAGDWAVLPGRLEMQRRRRDRRATGWKDRRQRCKPILDKVQKGKKGSKRAKAGA